METVRTSRPMDFVNILEKEGIAYTYVRVTSPLKKDLSFTFEKGVKDSLDVISLPVGSNLDPITASNSENDSAIYREDVAALLVQSLMTLDWNTSRILEISSSPNPIVDIPSDKKPRGQKFDKEWCTNSDLIRERLLCL